jgi:repressor LexA
LKTATSRQQEVLDYIVHHNDENGYAPSVREIAGHFSVSLGTVQGHLDALKRKGCLEGCAEKRSRAMRVPSLNCGSGAVSEKQRAGAAAEKTCYIPLVGTVAAGTPLLSEENFDGTVPVARELLKPGRCYFALRVQGESMIGAGILDGDLAVIEQQSTAENGQIVVAVVDEGITLKKFYLQAARRILLKSANPKFGDIYTQDARIAGILSHIIRKYE